jgi:antitoxin component HigA of HigAB toxin-antitoxin module
MEADGLKQSELPEVGSQEFVSAIPSGERELNIRQIRRLAKRFGVPLPSSLFYEKNPNFGSANSNHH